MKNKKIFTAKDRKMDLKVGEVNKEYLKVEEHRTQKEDKKSK